MKHLPRVAIVAALATLVDNLVFGAFLASHLDVAPLALAVLTCPSLLVAPWGARLVDRLGVRRALHVVKLIEIAGLAAFVVPKLGWLAIALMGTKASLLAPAKYADAPHAGHGEAILKASMLVATATTIAMLGGISGGYYLMTLGGSARTMATLVVIAALGWTLVPFTNARPMALYTGAEEIMSPQSRRLAVLGIGWFWFYAVLLVGMLVPYARVSLSGDVTLALWLEGCLAAGFIAGASTCSALSQGVLELGVVPAGAAGTTIFTAFLWFGGMLDTPSPAHAELLAVLAGITLAWQVVPLYALVHQRTAPSDVARLAASSDRVSSAFVIAAAGVLWLCVRYGIPAHWLFLTLAAMNAAVAIFIYAYIPEFMLRFAIWMLAHVMYRVRIVGREHLPQRGPAVLVCNHVSFVDWLIIGSASRLPVRFVMHYSFMNIPVAKYLFADARIIPIAGAKEDPETLEKAFDAIATALADDEIVCIFPEGKITTDGVMSVFRPGIEKIIARTPVPVVPMAVVGMWGSFFSKSEAKGFGKRFWSRVTVQVGAPLQPAQVTAAGLETQVKTLGSLA